MEPGHARDLPARPPTGGSDLSQAPRRLLSRRGPAATAFERPAVILPRRARGVIAGLMRRFGQRLNSQMPMRMEERRRIIQALYPEGREFRPFMRRFSLLMGLAVAIAVFGLIADSTAVVIGAMLVAPLLTPILGLSGAVIMGWPRRFARYSILVLVGSAGAALLAGFLAYAVRLELNPIPSEVLARTAPNLRDLGIALAAGVAGAFAIVRRAAGDAMSGAAVAVALVPPLSAAGVLLQQGEPDLAIGAFLLFSTNVAGVVFASAVTFIASGFVPGMQLLQGATRTATRLRWMALAVVIVVLPIQLDRPGLLQPAPAFEEIAAQVEEWGARQEAEVDLVEVEVDVDDGTAVIDVIVTASEHLIETDRLASELSEHLSRPVELSLQVVPAAISEVSADETG